MRFDFIVAFTSPMLSLWNTFSIQNFVTCGFAICAAALTTYFFCDAEKENIDLGVSQIDG
jgi:hypothetical protein